MMEYSLTMKCTMVTKILTHADEITDKELTICMSCISYDIASNMKNINHHL